LLRTTLTKTRALFAIQFSETDGVAAFEAAKSTYFPPRVNKKSSRS